MLHLIKRIKPSATLKKQGFYEAFNFFLISSLIVISHASTAATTANQTKLKLDQVSHQINKLERTLDSAHDKNKQLSHELALIEKKISLSVKAYHNTQQSIMYHQHKIDALQQDIKQLNDQLHLQQSLLAKSLRARYMIGEHQPIQWLLNQEALYKTDRILTFYQYLMKSRQKNINQIHTIQVKLTLDQNQLNQALQEQVKRRDNLLRDQMQLKQDKYKSKTILHALNTDIHNKQQILQDYQNNKNNLSTLLKKLNIQHIMKNQRPFIFARKKLPQPVNISRNNVRTINQGLLFSAPEGTAVTAVYPGKIVFSDWLKGYGLLLIIDHGRGFMTLYAHNQSLFKKKGDIVNQNDHIAAVGHSGGVKQNGLYFEIRQRGKAISPRAWLS